MISVNIESRNYPAGDYHYRIITRCGVCQAVNISHKYTGRLTEDAIEESNSALENKGWLLSEDIENPLDICPKCDKESQEK